MSMRIYSVLSHGQPVPLNPPPKVYEVFLENPVSVNHQFFTKTVKSKKSGQMVPLRITTSQAKDFKEYAGWKFKEAGIPVFNGGKKVVFEVWGIWPDRLKRDLSNFSKPVLDAFKACGYVPDDNICLWREQDYWTEKDVFGLKLKIYESELAA
ncbi:MAG: hypothetical protein KGL39_31930 [Patescibacteria group bacterium]|nr:hypothetical protein [Patescibacteria group bacterium]